MEQLQQCLNEFADFDGNAENSESFINLLELINNSSKDLLKNDQLFEPVFQK